MKCINNKIKSCVLISLCIILLITACGSADDKKYLSEYETQHYQTEIKRYHGFAEKLCVTDKDITSESFTPDGSIDAAGLFDVANSQTLYANSVHKKAYPASTTKILTAYIALKYANLDDIVTANHSASFYEAGAQLCGLQEGDQITMKDLVYALLIYSGNDAADAIAEHISGSIEAFADLMNEEAARLGATNSHFVNPHGLHNENHYTTAYDLYLIFNECIKNETFLDIIHSKSYTGTVTDVTGQKREITWEPTNFYFLGTTPMPEGMDMIGGKTGYTSAAGACLIFYEKDAEDNPYISVILGAASKPILYHDMTALINSI